MQMRLRQPHPVRTFVNYNFIITSWCSCVSCCRVRPFHPPRTQANVWSDGGFGGQQYGGPRIASTYDAEGYPSKTIDPHQRPPDSHRTVRSWSKSGHQCAHARTVCILLFGKVNLENRFENQNHRHHAYSIPQAWKAQGPSFAIGLWYTDPLDRSRSITLLFQCLRQFPQATALARTTRYRRRFDRRPPVRPCWRDISGKPSAGHLLDIACLTRRRTWTRVLPSLSPVTQSADSWHFLELIGFPISGPHHLSTLVLNCGPFPPPALPDFLSTTSHSAILRGRAWSSPMSRWGFPKPRPLGHHYVAGLICRVVKGKYSEMDDNKDLYCLRHFFITIRILAGLNVYDIAKICGTSLVQIQKHYDAAESLVTSKKMNNNTLRFDGMGNVVVDAWSERLVL